MPQFLPFNKFSFSETCLKTSFTLLVSIILLACAACTPDQFKLNRMQNIVACEVIGSLDGAEQTANNAIDFNGGTVVLRTYSLTQFIADFSVNVRNGEGFSFYIRTTKHDFQQGNFIRFNYSINGCSICESGKPEIFNNSVAASLNRHERINLINDGKIVIVKVGCDTVFSLITERHATDCMLVKSINGTKGSLYGIDIMPFYEEYE